MGTTVTIKKRIFAWKGICARAQVRIFHGEHPIKSNYLAPHTYKNFNLCAADLWLQIE